MFYAGGCPVPAHSVFYNGGQYTNAVLHTDVGVFSLLFAFLKPIQTTKPQGLCDPRPVKDSG
jgi:hypothetical protein